MKVKHLFLAVLAMAAVATGCKKDESDSKPSLKLDPSELEFEAVAGTMTVKVDANQAWEIDGIDDEWVALSQESGDGAADIEVSVTENTSSAARTAKITFRCSIVKKTLTITQAGKDGSSDEGDGTKAKPYTVAQAKAIAEKLDADAYSNAPVYMEGIVVSLKDPATTISKYGSVTLYVSDSGESADQFYVYALVGFDGAKFTSEDTLPFKVGSKVVLYGYLQNFKGNTPEMTRNSSNSVAPQLVSVDGKGSGDSEVETTSVEGVVIAAANSLFLVRDAENKIQLVYGTEAAGKVKVGDTVSVEGEESEYNGTAQIKNATVTVKASGAEVTYPEAEEISGSAIGSYSTVFGYVKLSGTLSISGNYYNLDIEGTTVKGSIVSPTQSVSGLDGLPVTVTGYYLYYSSNGAYFNVCATEIKGEDYYFSVNPTEINVSAEVTSATIGIQSSVVWTASSETEGFTIDKTSGNGDATITVSFAANTDTENGKTATVKITTSDTNIAAGEREVAVTINQGKASSGNELKIVLDAADGANWSTDIKVDQDYKNQTLTTTIGGYSWTFFAGTKFHLYPDGYFLWGKKDAYILMPAVEGKSLSKVTILTGKSASVKVSVGVYDAAGTAAVSGGSEIILNAKDTEFSWTLAGTAANTSYQLRVCNANNAQLQKLTLIYE